MTRQSHAPTQADPSQQQDDVELWHISPAELNELETSRVDEAAHDDDASIPEAQTLPLVVREPMRVRFGDRVVRLEQQGLYMFHYRGVLHWPEPDALPTVVKRAHVDTSVIYFDGDFNALFAGLATLQVHGWVHNDLSVEEKLAKMKHGLLSCTCGYIAELGVHLLRQFGYHARLVAARRVRGAYNARDDGHVLMEYFNPQHRQWILVDLDTHSTFAWQGKPLSLGQVTDCIHAGQPFEIVPMTPPGLAIPDTTGYIAPETGNTYMTFKLSSPPHLRQWFEQMFEVPLMLADDQKWFWHPNDALATRAANYSSDTRRLSRDEWFARFYAEPEA